MKIRAGSPQCCGLAYRVEDVGILHRKRFKIKVLGNGISGILRPSLCVTMSTKTL